MLTEALLQTMLTRQVQQTGYRETEQGGGIL